MDMEKGHISTKCTNTITIIGALVPYRLFDIIKVSHMKHSFNGIF
jgi:hypothetical protein